MYPIPPVNSLWFNNNRKKVFRVFGLVSPCEEEDWEILYRSDDMPQGEYRRRSLEEWYGKNRHGEPRFVPVPENKVLE
jgi:hypothetical protein